MKSSDIPVTDPSMNLPDKTTIRRRTVMAGDRP